MKKKITHALLCGNIGQIFGTEKQCKKYYSAWDSIFPLVFENGIETDDYKINNYGSTFNLVNLIIEKNDNLIKEAKKGFFSKLHS